jgi:hypothetical protein
MSAEHGIFFLNLQMTQTGAKLKAALPLAPPPPPLLLPPPRLLPPLTPPEPLPPGVPEGLAFGVR